MITDVLDFLKMIQSVFLKLTVSLFCRHQLVKFWRSMFVEDVKEFRSQGLLNRLVSSAYNIAVKYVKILLRLLIYIKKRITSRI